jgi:hypothetical protein
MIRLHIVPELFFPKFKLIKTHWQVFWLVRIPDAFPGSSSSSPILGKIIPLFGSG